MKAWIDGEGAITLNQRHFVGRGGQGTVYSNGTTAYKIFDQSGTMIPVGKLRELSNITDPQVIKPEKVVYDQKRNPIGYTMRYIFASHVLCELFPKAFRERHGISPQQILNLVTQLRTGVAQIHAAGVLVVDLNEMNILLSNRFDELFFIDVDSYQTSHYPAVALMDAIRDRHSPKNIFNIATDWFSFAVISFQMFVGIHPYKGRHPTVKGLDARMRANISVFNSDVRMPKSVYPLDTIPTAYRQWYEAVFEKGKRCPPPTEVDTVQTVTPSVRHISGPQTLSIHQLHEFSQPIIAIWSQGPNLVVATEDGVWLNGRRRVNQGATIRGVGFGFRRKTPIAIFENGDMPHLYDLSEKCPIDFEMKADGITSYNGRIYMKTKDKILAVDLTEMGDQLFASPRIAAQVLDYATRLYDGVAIQNLLGATFAIFFPHPKSMYQCHIKELDSYHTIAAKFDTNVLMVTGEQAGRFDRLVFRFDADFANYDLRIVEDVSVIDINFAVLDTGVCVCLNEEENLELFSIQRGTNAMKVIMDSNITGDLRLTKRGGELLAYRGTTVYSMSMR